MKVRYQSNLNAYIFSTRKKQRAKISEKSPRDIQDTTKWTNIFIKGDPEKEEREKGGRKFI